MAFSKQHDARGLARALRNLRKARRKPDDVVDRPPPSTFPGRQPRQIDGQPRLEGEAERDDD